MAGGQINITPVRSGDDKVYRVTVKANKVPVDITGDKFYFTVKDDKFYEDAEADLQVSVIAAGTNAAAGIVFLHLPKASTLNVSPGTYYYDIVWIRLTSSSGEKVLVREGIISFDPAVTYATT